MIRLAFPLTDDEGARIQAGRKEACRLYGLADRWLAEELLRLARRARADIPALAGTQRRGYNGTFVWRLVPELAARLGATAFQPGEREGDDTFVNGPPELLRLATGLFLRNVEPNLMVPSGARPSAWEMLTRDFASGNPVAIATDRICAPSGLANDWLERRTREVSRLLGPERATWCPEMTGGGLAGSAAPNSTSLPPPAAGGVHGG